MFLKKIRYVVKTATNCIDISLIATYNEDVVEEIETEVIKMKYQVNIKLIKQRRIEEGLTLKQMADALGIESKANYYKRENGDTKFKSSELPIISDVLNIDYKKIFIKTLIKSKP